MPNKPAHNKIFVVDLTEEEKNTLLDLTKKGNLSARKLKRANILLLAHDQKTDREIAEALHCSIPTIERTRKRFVEEGSLAGALNEKPRPGMKAILDDKGEIILATIVESKPPAGRKRWTLKLLADRLVELEVADTISRDTVRRTLKKIN